MATDNKDKNIHKDHRKKVREKFYECGFQGMASHNILEMLLFFGIPYKDTNSMAHELIEKFGSLSGVFEAKRSDLLQIKGMTENAACLISMILPLYRKYSEDLGKRRKTFSNTKEIVDFLQPLYLDNNNIERVYVLCFDSKGSLITYRMINEGDINSSDFDYRKISALVLETNAASVIVSHNHPHGIASPSLQDIEVTKSLFRFLLTLKVKLEDHLIITDDEYFSMAKSSRFAHIFMNIQ